MKYIHRLFVVMCAMVLVFGSASLASAQDRPESPFGTKFEYPNQLVMPAGNGYNFSISLVGEDHLLYPLSCGYVALAAPAQAVDAIMVPINTSGLGQKNLEDGAYAIYYGFYKYCTPDGSEVGTQLSGWLEVYQGQAILHFSDQEESVVLVRGHISLVLPVGITTSMPPMAVPTPSS